MGWAVYMVRCKKGELYTGTTTEVERRVGQHNRGVGSKFTRGRGPVELVYLERVRDRSAALRREGEIKRMGRVAKLALVQMASANKE